MKQNKQQLRNSLNRLDGKSYKLYKDIKGECSFGHFTVFVDHVQGDPFASPSRIRVQLSKQMSQFPVNIFHNRSRSVALRDFLARCFSRAVKKYSKRITEQAL